MGVVEKIDREDKNNVIDRYRSVRRNRGKLNESRAKRGGYVSYRVPGKVLHASSNLALGDMLRRSIENREKALAHLAERPAIVLVKDGKLTPEGIARGIKL